MSIFNFPKRKVAQLSRWRVWYRYIDEDGRAHVMHNDTPGTSYADACRVLLSEFSAAADRVEIITEPPDAS